MGSSRGTVAGAAAGGRSAVGRSVDGAGTDAHCTVMTGDVVADLMSGIGVERERAVELLSVAHGSIEHATEIFFAVHPGKEQRRRGPSLLGNDERQLAEEKRILPQILPRALRGKPATKAEFDDSQLQRGL
eukprot:gene21629-1030_t